MSGVILLISLMASPVFAQNAVVPPKQVAKPLPVKPKINAQPKVKALPKPAGNQSGQPQTVAYTPRFTSWSSAFQALIDENRKGSDAYKQLSALIKATGHRLTGSNQGKQATAFVHDLMKTYGYGQQAGLGLSLQPFQVQAWRRNDASLDLVPRNSDNYMSLSCVSLALTPASSNTLAEIVDCGNGLPEDWASLGDKVKGKTALINIGLEPVAGKPAKGSNLHRSEKIALAMKAGAVAAIMINQAPGDILLTGTASTTGQIIAIPAVCISKNAGVVVREMIVSERMMADLKVSNTIEKQEVHNVIATVAGSDKAAEEIVIGCHLDSWDLAQGACDNGAGSAAVIELARLFSQAKFKPRRTLKFVWFMGEEQGLLGSKHYVKSLSKSGLATTRYMVNLDMAYNSRGFNLSGRPEAQSFFDSVSHALQQIDSTLKLSNRNKAHLHSDHQPFMTNGIPVTSPDAQWSPEALHCYHADCDRLNWVNADGLDRTAKLTAALLYALGHADQLPAKRLDKQQTRQFLIDQGLDEALKLHDE